MLESAQDGERGQVRTRSHLGTNYTRSSVAIWCLVGAKHCLSPFVPHGSALKNSQICPLGSTASPVIYYLYDLPTLYLLICKMGST